MFSTVATVTVRAQVTVGQITGHLHELAQKLERLIGFTRPGVNLRQALQDEHPIVGVAAQRHQLNRVTRFRERLFLAPKTSVDLREHGDGSRVVRLDR